MPHLAGLHVEQVSIADDAVHIDLHRTARAARCPGCRRHSHRVHSSYRREIADLPIDGHAVLLHRRVRRRQCAAPQCPRRIFAEQVPGLAGRRVRRSTPLLTSLREIGCALGGRAGARQESRLQMSASRSTLLRLVRQAPSPPLPDTPRVLGADDWAWQRGQRYGSILVDLERRRPIKLLPDRTAESLAAGLREHPGVDVISRDRAGAYADGARQGAPDAVQVADRFHILANAGELLERVLGSRRAALRAAAAAVDRTFAQARQPATAATAPPDPSPGKRRAQQRAHDRRAHRLARYGAVLALHQEGHSHAAISRQTGLGRRTVRRYLRAGAFPERAAAPARPTMLAPYEAYLRTRWTEGCHSAHQLRSEIRGRGHAGQAANVRRYLARWRPAPGRPGPTVGQGQSDHALSTPPV